MALHTAVIGAGMSGLAAALRIACYGGDVAVFEKHFLPGGLNSFYRRNGHTLETGLHAMTNFSDRKNRHAPLNKMLRQLKIGYEELSLLPQKHSEISFPDLKIFFTNNISDLKEQIFKYFPDQVSGFEKLLDFISSFDALKLENSGFISARKTVADFITDPLLSDMLFCPLFFYGSAWENDMDLPQFIIMFQSVFLEGFCRPAGGVRSLLDLLISRLNDSGGKIYYGCEVKQILVRDGKAAGVLLSNGETFFADNVISCAGLVETAALAGFPTDASAGKMAFTEVILGLSSSLHNAGHDAVIRFYSDSKKFSYQHSETPVDLSSGVLCCPDNFSGEYQHIPMLRITNIASPEFWINSDKEIYQQAKSEYREKIISKAISKLPLKQDQIIFSDMFTPKTVMRYTGHLNGAVYGTPHKLKNGVTPVKNLFITGTDQGFLGITGALLSGISLANLHCLK